MGRDALNEKPLYNQMKTTAIIVLHFGEVENTLRCLDSIQKIKDLDTSKVFIIDNGTGKINKNHLKIFRFQYTLIKNKKNLGYAGGNNVGIRKALEENYDYIFLLNNDATVKSTILSDLQKPLQSSRIGITGCIITYKENGDKIWFAGGSLNKVLCITRHLQMNKILSDTIIRQSETDFITGAAMMVKREVFNDVGLIPEEYFLYWEDVDFCYSARKKLYKCYLINKPLVQHIVSASSGKKGSNRLSSIRAYYYARNPFIFMSRHQLNPLTVLCGQLAIRLPYSLLTLQDFPAAAEYVRGIKDGLRSMTNSSYNKKLSKI